MGNPLNAMGNMFRSGTTSIANLFTPKTQSSAVKTTETPKELAKGEPPDLKTKIINVNKEFVAKTKELSRLESKLDKIKGSRFSPDETGLLKSIGKCFEKINRNYISKGLEKQIGQKKTELNAVSTNYGNLVKELSSKGQPVVIKKGLPSEYYPKNSDIPTNAERGSRIREIANNFASIKANIINSIPDFKLNHSDLNLQSGFHNFNNYGYRPEEGEEFPENPGEPEGAKIQPKEDGMIYPIGNADINCDKVLVDQGRDFATAVFCDGCGQGNRSLTAADTASGFAATQLLAGVQNKIVGTDKKMESVRDVVQLHLETLEATQADMMAKNVDGQTTISLATVVDNYAVLSHIGDSKAFIIRKDSESGKLTCFEPTEGSRGSGDSKDPGGMLGDAERDQSGKPYADYRNLGVEVVLLEKGDLIMLCSDGIHDNLDPETLGLTPTSQGYLGDKWTEKDKNDFMKKTLNSILKGCSNFTEMNKKIDDFIYQSTAALKRELLTSVNPRETAKDHQKFPGKPDHAGRIFIQYDGVK